MMSFSFHRMYVMRIMETKCVFLYQFSFRFRYHQSRISLREEYVSEDFLASQHIFTVLRTPFLRPNSNN